MWVFIDICTKNITLKGYVLATENAAGNKIGKGPLLF